MDEGLMQTKKQIASEVAEMDLHTERKIVVSINYPKTARIEVQRISSNGPSCDKEMFIRLRAYFKAKFEGDDEAIEKQEAEQDQDWDDLD